MKKNNKMMITIIQNARLCTINLTSLSIKMTILLIRIQEFIIAQGTITEDKIHCNKVKLDDAKEDK